MKNKKSTSKNWKWIVQNKSTGLFFNKNKRYSYTKELKNAEAFNSRSVARNAKFEDETVKKVLISGKSIPIKIIS